MLSFKDFTKTKVEIPAVYMNAGGPLRHLVNEGTRFIGTTLMDPIQDSSGAGSKENDHVNFIKSPSKQEGFKSPRRVFSNLSNQQADTYKTLSIHTEDHRSDPSYKSTVASYTSNSDELNYHLYEAHKNGIRRKPKVGRIAVKAMDDLIKAHRTPHSLTVYTGPHFDPHEHAGKDVDAPAYTSTSLTPHVAKDFGSSALSEGDDVHVLRVHLPENHPFLFADHESRYPGQGEVILPRGMKFHIGSSPTHSVTGRFASHFDNYTDSQPQTVHFWDAHVISTFHKKL